MATPKVFRISRPAKGRTPKVETLSTADILHEAFNDLSPLHKAEVALIGAAATTIGETIVTGGDAIAAVMAGKMPRLGKKPAMTRELHHAAIAYAKVATAKKKPRKK